jgi:type II secretion system protein C
MQSKAVKLLLLILTISLGYIWWSLFVHEDNLPNTLSSNIEQEFNSSANERPISPTNSLPIAVANQTLQYADEQPDNTQAIALPKQFRLLGTQVRTDDLVAKALIDFKGGLEEYEQGDWVLDTAMRLSAINKTSIDIEYQERIFVVALTPPNLLAADYRKPEKSRAEHLAMTPKQIGSRPRIIEHIFILTPTPYIADGKLVNPGLNPALFKSVGFENDDVLKTINGKSVTIEQELDDIKEELKTAHTLIFTVMRKGRIITLYLDIPSEALELSID